MRLFILAFFLLATVSVGWLVRAQEQSPPTLKAGGKNYTRSQPSPPKSNGEQHLSDDDVVRVETNLVTVPAMVMDREGRYVTNLSKEAFQIFEDGAEQEVALFSSVEQPFTILFLLDISGSMTYQMDDLAKAANEFVGRLRPQDQLIAVSFDDWVNVLFEPIHISDLRKGIRLRQRVGARSTMIYDAVDYGLERVKKIRGRKAIVLFSDGYGSGTFATAKGNLREAEEMDVIIYTVQFDSLPAEPPRSSSREAYFKRVEEGDGYMRALARKTGGRHYEVESIPDLGKAFGLVAAELGQQYSLGYYPKRGLEPGQTRRTKVRVTKPNLAVRYRESYLVDNHAKKN